MLVHLLELPHTVLVAAEPRRVARGLVGLDLVGVRVRVRVRVGVKVRVRVRVRIRVSGAGQGQG